MLLTRPTNTSLAADTVLFLGSYFINSPNQENYIHSEVAGYYKLMLGLWFVHVHVGFVQFFVGLGEFSHKLP